jgi:putative sporulation protein yyaC
MNISKKQTKRKTEYFNPAQTCSFRELGNSILHMIDEAGGADRSIVLICIGTDRATGDALGPLVGDYILAHDTCYQVAGTLEYPVHALNIRETINTIYTDFDNPFVIAIDASLGLSKDMGLVTITNSHLFPGKGVNKKLPAIGDISITGIVNLSGRSGANLLQNTRLYTVKTMAEYIGRALVYADNHLSSPL